MVGLMSNNTKNCKEYCKLEVDVGYPQELQSLQNVYLSGCTRKDSHWKKNMFLINAKKYLINIFEMLTFFEIVRFKRLYQS